MVTKRIFLLVVIFGLALAACGGQAAAPMPAEEGRVDGYTDLVLEPTGTGGGEAVGMAPPDFNAYAETETDSAAKGAQANRLVIKTANLTMVVSDPAQASSQIAALANGLGGFVVTSYVYQSQVDAAGNEIMQASITVRVPTAALDSTLAQIREMAVEVKNENISGQDVTAEFTDLESRLRNLEAAEAQLAKIMEQATRTEDVLSVFNQLTYIREQIEQVKGQMKYYSEAAALSAISIELIPDVLSQPIEVNGWRPEGIAKEALEALLRAFQGMATILIWLTIYALPLALVVGVPLWTIARVVARRVRRPDTTSTPA